MSLKILLVVGLSPFILARPDTYKETEDFQFSRSDSDQGQKSGFYAAQRGNVGGNFEKSHNMDHLAQNQMSDLAHQVGSQLAVDPASLQGGNLYGSASTSGVTSLNQQHLNSQRGLGSSRLAGVKTSGYAQQGALSSQNRNQLGYGGQYYTGSADRQSHETQQAYEARQRLASTSSQLNSQTHSNFGLGLEAGSADRQSHETQQAYEARQRLASTSSQLNSQTHSNFGSGLEAGNTYQQTVVRPVYPGQTVHLTARPGRVTHLTLPVRTQAAYDAQSQNTGATLTSAGSTYNRQSATANTDFLNGNSEVTGQRGRSQYNRPNVHTADDLSTSQYNQREDESSRGAQSLNTGSSTRHEYGYNKQWERHGTVVPDTLQFGVGNVETGTASNARNLQTDYNALSHNTEDQALESGSRQEYSQRYGKQWERQGSRTVPSSSVNHLSTGVMTESDRRHVNYEDQGVGTTSLHSSIGNTNQAQRARTNFNTDSASQALEAGTAYNTDVELLNGQNLGTNLDLGSTGVTTAPKRYESSYSYHKAWERKGTPYVIQPASSSLTAYNGQGASANEEESQLLSSHRATDQSSGQRAYFTKGGSQNSASSGSSSHSTGIGSQSSMTENMARLQETLQQQQERMRASLCDAECASAKANKYEAQYSYSRQHSYRKKRSPTKKNSNDYDYGKNYEDMGQQMEDFGQIPEDLGQMSEDFGQLPEEFGQQPENVNQMPVDFSHQSETNPAAKLGRTLGSRKGQR